MANFARGEVDFQVERVTYRLVLDMNALCELEELKNEPWGVTFERMGSTQSGLRMTDLRSILWAALRARHPSITVEGAGNILQTAGPESVLEAVTEALRRARPAAEEGGPSAGNPPSPREGQASTEPTGSGPTPSP